MGRGERSYCALDFGTSNSVLLARDATGQVRTHREKSLLLFPDDNSPHYEVGNRALAVYESNGRKGRLIQSIKSLLPYTTFQGSRIGGSWRTLESLLTLVLAHLRESSARLVGRDLRGVVLGRPVRFSSVAQEERIAEERLRLAAAAAGFDEMQLVLEPVAAAAAYRRVLSRPELTLIADIGAGTSDFSVVRLEPTTSGSWERSRVLSSAGVKLGGDNVDGLIMWHKLTRYFGRGTKWESGGKWLDIPARIFRDLCQWHRLPFLRESKTRDDIDTFIRRSATPEGLRRLARLIDRDLGYGVFRSIENAKIELSSGSASGIVFNEEGLQIEQLLTLSEMSEWLGEFEAEILSCLNDVIRAAGVSAGDIESIFITGGTSLLPPVREMIVKCFSGARVEIGDPFDSVALGLLELVPS